MDMGTKHIILALGAFGAGISAARLLGRRTQAQPVGLAAQPRQEREGFSYSKETQDAIAAGEVLGAPRMRGNTRLKEMAAAFTSGTQFSGVHADSVKPESLGTRGQITPDSPSCEEIMAAVRGAK